MSKEKIVYVVHSIDTEGPLYESIEATFNRVNNLFNLNLEVSKENLRKLQNKEINLDGKEDAVYNIVAPKRINTNDTWDKIDNMLDEITSDKFRKKYKDSYGNGWIYNWFCMDHAGFTGENPRRRDLGYHNIFDHYRLYNELNNNDEDMIQWHYHPLSMIKDAHRSGTTYLNSSNIYEILARKIIDRKWFPAAFRPGFHTERPDSHWFLEQWIPFDYANQATDEINDQPDVAGGRFGNWQNAPKNWTPYNPDFYDYRKKGNCNRYIAKCLNMEARYNELNLENIRNAFKEAKDKGKSLLSFTNHDFRDMKAEIAKIYNIIEKVNKEFENVSFKFENAVEGMRKVLDLSNKNNPNFKISLEKKNNSTVLNIKVTNNIFGVQPFLAIKTTTNEYHWQNLDFEDDNKWSFTFDFHTLLLKAVDKIGIAANTQTGVTEVVIIDPQDENIEKRILNK